MPEPDCQGLRLLGLVYQIFGLLLGNMPFLHQIPHDRL